MKRMNKLDRNEMRVELKKKINEFLDLDEDRDFYLGSYTVDMMVENCLSILWAIEDVQKYLKEEGLFE